MRVLPLYNWLVATYKLPCLLTKEYSDPGGPLALTGDPGCLIELSRNRRKGPERAHKVYIYYVVVLRLETKYLPGVRRRWN